MPVVALAGTTTVKLVPSAATLAAVATVVPNGPSSEVRKTTRSPLVRPLPASVIVWPVLADGIPLCRGVPLVAAAVIPVRLVLPVPTRCMTRA